MSDYHKDLVKLCQVLCAVHVDGDLFDRIAPADIAELPNNMQIRWAMEDKIRELLAANGDFPPKG